ncbi:MAG: nitrilase-related carbon-nitrogen hydrolase [Nitrososphaerales archaeon]
MSRSVTLGLIQMSMSADKEENLSKSLKMIEEASEGGAQILCLPELFATHYFPQDKKSKGTKPETIPGPTSNFLSRAARKNKVVIVGGSIFETHEGRNYNSSVVFDQEGRMLGKYRKVHVPEDEAFYEKDYFSPGKSYKVFKTPFAKIGVLICFDQWYPEPARIERLLGADIVFYPTAIGTVRGIEQVEGNWKEAWEGVQRGHAISNSLIVAAVNRVGKEKEMRFWGCSFVYDQFGKLLASGDASKEQIIIVECDLGLGRQVEQGWGFLKNRNPETYSKLTQITKNNEEKN